MASLIWENVGFISNGNVKLRVKMNDDSNMSDSDEGISFMNTMSGSNNREIAFKEFRWSLGFGVEGFDYEEFWNPLDQNESFTNHFGSLGNGIGVVKSNSVLIM